MEKKRRNTLITVIACLALIAALLIVYGLILPKTDNGEKTVTLEIKYSDASYSYRVTTDSATVYELLDEYDERLELGLDVQDSAYGKYIVGLKGTAQDMTNGYYYTYKLNDEYSNFGISTQAIADGDVIVFEYGVQRCDEDWAMLSTELAPGGDESVRSTPMRTGNIVLIAAGGVAALMAIGAGVYLVLATKRR